MRKLGKWSVVLGLVTSLGGHWALLQMVAWASMVIQFSAHEPLRVALAKTFDGQHPCALCQFVAVGKKADTAPRAVVPAPVCFVDFFLDQPSVFEFAAQGEVSLWRGNQVHPPRFDPPPTPPPRRA